MAVAAGLAAHAITDFGLWNQLFEHGNEAREALVFISQRENRLFILDVEGEIFGDREGGRFIVCLLYTSRCV